jgi:NitT/TauT family transport system substrate-binding protein
MTSLIRTVSFVALSMVCAMGVATAQTQKLRITIPAHSLFFTYLFAAEDKGFFKENGIEMEIVTTQGDGPDVDALIAGSVQFTASTSNRLLTTYEAGRPLLGVMGLLNKPSLNCFMNKQVADRLGINAKTPAEEKFRKLKGLNLAGTRPGSYIYLMQVDYLKRVGMELNRDARFVGVGNGQAMIASVENGQADMGCFAGPFVEMAIQRGKSVWFMNNTKGDDPRYSDFLFQVLYVRPDYAKSNADTVRKVVASLVKANQWQIKASDAEMLAVIKPRFKAIDDELLLAAMSNIKSAVNPTGRMTERSVNAVGEFLRNTDMLKTTIPWTAITDNSYLPK